MEWPCSSAYNSKIRMAWRPDCRETMDIDSLSTSWLFRYRLLIHSAAFQLSDRPTEPIRRRGFRPRRNAADKAGPISAGQTSGRAVRRRRASNKVVWIADYLDFAKPGPQSSQLQLLHAHSYSGRQCGTEIRKTLMTLQPGLGLARSYGQLRVSSPLWLWNRRRCT